MDVLLRAHQVLDNDKDFEYLHREANSVTIGTMWDASAEEVVKTWEEIPYFHNMYIEDYIARFKATMFFAIAISKVLEAMHVEDNDPTKMKQIPGTDKLVNIYTSPKPWVQRFHTLNNQGRLCPYVEEDVSVYRPEPGSTFLSGKYTEGVGTIKFILEEPVLILDPHIAEYKIKYMESLIRIEVMDEAGHLTFKEMHLRDLNINKVLETINAAGLI